MSQLFTLVQQKRNFYKCVFEYYHYFSTLCFSAVMLDARIARCGAVFVFVLNKTPLSPAAAVACSIALWLWCRETVPLSAVHSSKCTMCVLQLFLVSDHIFRNSIVNCNVDNIYNFIYFQCAKIIKETMEEKYGGMGKWQVVIGESFGVDITYDTESLFYMYFVGTVACFVWKCSRSWGIITTCKTFLCAAILSCIGDCKEYYMI